MERRRVVWSFPALSLVLSFGACSPSAAELRPSSMDSGRSGDVTVTDAIAADAVAPDAIATDAMEPDAYDDREPDFRLVLVDRPESVARGETATLRVRIDRVGGFDAPVLIDLWGLPDTVWAQARESRVDDGVIEITVEASEDAPVVEDTAFAVQASALGIRRVERATISIR